MANEKDFLNSCLAKCKALSFEWRLINSSDNFALQEEVCNPFYFVWNTVFPLSQNRAIHQQIPFSIFLTKGSHCLKHTQLQLFWGNEVMWSQCLNIQKFFKHFPRFSPLSFIRKFWWRDIWTKHIQLTAKQNIIISGHQTNATLTFFELCEVWHHEIEKSKNIYPSQPKAVNVNV